MGNTNNLVVNNYWESKYYGTLGLLDILTVDRYFVMQDIEESIAEHLVEVHNAWYATEVWKTYIDNYKVAVYNDAIYKVIDNCSDDETEIKKYYLTKLVNKVEDLPSGMK